MTVDEEREVVMGELWVSHDELVDAIGDDGADLLCRAVGGVSTYIPRTQPEGSPLCGVIGMERMMRVPRFPPSSGWSAWKGSVRPSAGSG